MFQKNVGLAGGMAPVRRYLPELLELVLDGRIDPGLVFDLTLPLDEVGRGLPRDGRAARDQGADPALMVWPRDLLAEDRGQAALPGMTCGWHSHPSPHSR